MKAISMTRIDDRSSELNESLKEILKQRRTFNLFLLCLCVTGRAEEVGRCTYTKINTRLGIE